MGGERGSVDWEICFSFVYNMTNLQSLLCLVCIVYDAVGGRSGGPFRRMFNVPILTHGKMILDVAKQVNGQGDIYKTLLGLAGIIQEHNLKAQ